jgi:hypothetical protein
VHFQADPPPCAGCAAGYDVVLTFSEPTGQPCAGLESLGILPGGGACGADEGNPECFDRSGGTRDPCDDCPCPEDINRDGTVDTADLVKLLAAWGDCDDGEFACSPPRECGTYEACTADPDCLCFRLSDGSGWCGSGSVSCGSVDECDGGECPAGFVCQVDTCCEVPICVPIETGCATGSAPTHDLPPGTRTNAGVIGPDGQLITQ